MPTNCPSEANVSNNLYCVSAERHAYLEASETIDHDHPAVRRRALELSKSASRQEETVRNCFEFVRDHIRHSYDFQLNPVTCKASDVLQYQTGYCYAKSHLLAALLRANGIPAGLCYQRLTVEGSEAPHCLHGLNAVYLDDYGWYRIDPRGNKPGVDAQFTPPLESLAFPVTHAGERDFFEIYSEPLPCVAEVLTQFNHFQDIAENLPDLDL